MYEPKETLPSEKKPITNDIIAEIINAFYILEYQPDIY